MTDERSILVRKTGINHQFGRVKELVVIYRSYYLSSPSCYDSRYYYSGVVPCVAKNVYDLLNDKQSIVKLTFTS